jgi:hypothetical protein
VRRAAASPAQHSTRHHKHSATSAVRTASRACALQMRFFAEMMLLQPNIERLKARRGPALLAARAGRVSSSPSARCPVAQEIAEQISWTMSEAERSCVSARPRWLPARPLCVIIGPDYRGRADETLAKDYATVSSMRQYGAFLLETCNERSKGAGTTWRACVRSCACARALRCRRGCP